MGRDFGRNPVGMGEVVLYGPNQAKHFQHVPFENIDLQ